MTTFVRRHAGIVCCAPLLWTAIAIMAAEHGEIKPFRPAALTPEQRERLDRQALELPEEEVRPTAIQYHGGVTEWMIARAPLPAEEEARRAAAAHEAIVDRWRSVRVPEAAASVLDRLVDELPARMRPAPPRFRLTVLDAPLLRAFTVGGGYLYITEPYLDVLLEADRSGTDRLAFVLAREIGHVALGHTRRAHQAALLAETAVRESVPEAPRGGPAWKAILDWAARTGGGLLTQVRTRKQVQQADLFGLSLCGNAGFAAQGALDVLRAWAAGDERGERGAAAQRLRRLLMEQQGIVENETFGLFEFDPETGAFSKLEDGALSGVAAETQRAPQRAIVFLPGLRSPMDVYRPLMERAAGEGRDDVRLLAFHYPSDGSLARSGRFLKRELDRTAGVAGRAGSLDRRTRLDFVAYSAGGLVFRFYAEVEGGAFRRAVFHGTPHAGSDLAALRSLLELRQFVGKLPLGYPQALEDVIADGDGQIGIDLEPDSLFLRSLDRAERRTERYFLFRGRALLRTHALALQVALAQLRGPLAERVLGPGEPGLLRRAAAEAIERLEIPEEIARGDLVVTLESAALAGAARLETVPVNHVELPRHPDVMEATVEILHGP